MRQVTRVGTPSSLDRMEPLRTLALVLLASVALTLGTAAPAGAVSVEEMATDMRAGNAVVSDPAAEHALSASEADALRAQIADTELPIFIGVLPASAGDAGDVLVELRDAVGLGGIYAVVVGDAFRAGSTRGSASDIATQAFREHRDAGVAAVLTAFVALANEQFDGAATVDSEPMSPLLAIFLILLAAAVVAVIVVLIVTSVRRQRLQLAQVREALDEDITEYGERLARFDTADPALTAEAGAQVRRAFDEYDEAKAELARMRSTRDAARVTQSLEDGRFALAVVDAERTGAPMPERRAPCFVDPRHGPSTTDVLWSPAGLTPRTVPMCAACASDVADGRDPAVREVTTTSGRRPYWDAGPQYGGYALGYYAPFGNLMTAVFVGSMLSHAWAVPGLTTGAHGGDAAGIGGGWDGGGWSGGGGGDFGGGGGFGGGDF